LFGVLAQLTVSFQSFDDNWQKMGNQEAAAIYLAGHMEPGDMVLAGYPNNAPVWYYLMRLDMSETAWQARAGAERYWLLLATNQKDQTLESIVKSYKLDPAQMDLPGAVMLQQYGKIKVYIVGANR
jgi:hypothetical protein